MEQFSSVDITSSAGSTSDRQAILGEIREIKHASKGAQQWRYILNTDVIPMPIGTLAQRTPATVNSGSAIVCVTSKCPKRKILGAAQYVIAVGYYGWVLAKGIGSLIGDGSVVANDTVHANGTSGRCVTSVLTNADEVAAGIGLALGADGIAGTLFDAEVDAL